MKKIIVLICTISILIACNTQNKPTKDGYLPGDDSRTIIDPKDSLKRTTIQWIDDSLGLGSLPRKGLVDVSFRFKNTGTKPLSINSVTAGCGCTQPEKPSGLVQPGQEGVVKAKFNTENQHGQVQKHLTVSSNTNPDTKELIFTANVVDK